MSLTLGEKLRQAREERGFTISDVAEQTRISSLYLQSIENDDYRILPGGIFNKGFLKTYAKFVGIDEAEALSEYSSLISVKTEDEESLKVYRPEVLTDDRSGSSMIPTVILAAVILGLMTAGILFLVNYLRQPPDTPVANANTRSNTNTSAETPAESTPAPTGAPDMATVKIEFKALSGSVSILATSDGKTSSSVVTVGTAANFEPKESLKLSYSRSLANFVQLTINGKEIKLPAQPLVPGRKAIEFEINKDNLAQVWSSASIFPEVPVAVPVATVNTGLPVNTAAAATPLATPARPTPAPKPSVAANSATNTSPRATPAARPPAQPRPTATNSQP